MRHATIASSLGWSLCLMPALLLWSSHSAATIYTCTASDGTKTYADRPCAPDAKTLEVTPQAPLSGVRSRAAPVPAACAVGQYTLWLRAQDSLPSVAARTSKIEELSHNCDPAWRPVYAESPVNHVIPRIVTRPVIAPQAGALRQAAPAIPAAAPTPPPADDRD
jgi:hypothetical protein